MLPTPKLVSEFYFGKNGLADRLSSSTLLIDCSTIGPVSACEIHETAKKHNLRFVDAPVSGGVKGAEEATLAFMVGSDNRAEYEVDLEGSHWVFKANGC